MTEEITADLFYFRRPSPNVLELCVTSGERLLVIRVPEDHRVQRNAMLYLTHHVLGLP